MRMEVEIDMAMACAHASPEPPKPAIPRQWPAVPRRAGSSWTDSQYLSGHEGRARTCVPEDVRVPTPPGGRAGGCMQGLDLLAKDERAFDMLEHAVATVQLRSRQEVTVGHNWPATQAVKR